MIYNTAMSSSNIERLRKLVQAESDLTTAIHIAEDTTTNTNTQFPTSMSDIEEILALAHVFASRTTAPIGWDPAYGTSIQTFATPAPLPHQLRAGNLGGLQLQRARLETKRKRLLLQAQQVQEQASASDVSQSKDLPLLNKRRQVVVKPKVAVPIRKAEKKVVASMNLSDSSDDSSSDEESD